MNDKEADMNKKMLVAVLIGAMLIISTIAVFAETPQDKAAAGAVYTMTNAADNNEIVIFDRDENGILTKAGSISTGGAGSGGGLDPLGSQGSIVLSQDKNWLLAVNAGSNEISVFLVIPNGLKLVDKVSSGGTSPVSLTIFHDLVYVLNADLPDGTSPSITGFYLSHWGKLTPLPNSTRLLGAGGFAQVGFDPRGNKLVVTDKPNDKILVYSVGHQGLASANPVITPSNGDTPFGFIFDYWGHLLVVEAGTDAVSSYKILHDNTLKVISPSVTNGQTASCWIAGSDKGFVFTANPGTSSISSYKLIIWNGKLTLLNGTAGTGNSPLDLSLVDGRFLYAVDPNGGGIDMFRVESDGSLTGLGTAAGELSVFAQGIAGR
jgi:6-phosphogluconolactonase (cycloisomerase 2 family)